MRRFVPTVAVVVAFAGVAPAARQGRPGPVEQLAWLAGCWQSNHAGRVIEEQWMSPRGGQMLGMSRTVRDTAVVEFEHLRIVAHDGRAIYHAEPSGQTPTDFTGSTVSDTLAIFENPAHDYPQRVIYRKHGRDSLLAGIDGTRNGQPHTVDFPYARVSCAR